MRGVVRNVLIALMLVPPAACLMIARTLRAQLIAFRREVPRLRSADDMQRLRRVAKFQMYATLAIFALIALPLLVWIYGKFIAGALGWLDVLWFVILPFVAMFVLSGDAPADEVRATPADTPELEKERDQVADVWVNRNFPDW
jgi:hypothetical protein